MGVLSDSFSVMLHAINMEILKHPIFYNAPIGIRFEIGGDAGAYLNDSHKLNPAYVSAAFDRAKTIYANLPHSPDILRIDGYPDEEKSAQKVVLAVCKEAKLPPPDEQELLPFRWYEDDESISQLQLYWDLKKIKFVPDVLLREIIKSDIGGGYSEFTSNVYFADTKNSILFHLYDDRGADLVGANKELIRPIFERFNNWILDYDREKINTTFTK